MVSLTRGVQSLVNAQMKVPVPHFLAELKAGGRPTKAYMLGRNVDISGWRDNKASETH